MFENAIEIVQGFTRPVLHISRSFGTDVIKQESATIFFVNEFGVAITTKEVISKLFPPEPYYERYKKFKKEKDNPGVDIQKLKLSFGYSKADAIIDNKTMFLNCGAGNKITTAMHPFYNLGILQLENVSNFTYEGYAKFDSSAEHLKKGKELTRLGYPFPVSSNFLYDTATDRVEWDMGKPFIIDSFPLKGIITRCFLDNGRPAEMEMSTPGYKGHHGCPLFDEHGYILGMHLGTTVVDPSDANAKFSVCMASNIITDFLSEAGIKYYQIEQGEQRVYNEQSTGFLLTKPLVPTFFLGSSDESAMRVTEVKMVIEDKVVVDYKEPFEVTVGKMDEGSKKDGAAMAQFSIDGRNEIFISEENSGSVRHLEKNNQFQLKVIKKECSSPGFKVKASVKTQSYFPYTYFDLLVIRRHVQRDHLKDPHITFFPDASGKYIRYDKEKNIKIVTKKVVHGRDAAILPLQSEIQADEFVININYIVNDDILSISDLSIAEKVV